MFWRNTLFALVTFLILILGARVFVSNEDKTEKVIDDTMPQQQEQQKSGATMIADGQLVKGKLFRICKSTTQRSNILPEELGTQDCLDQGFATLTSEGYLVTAGHVVENPSENRYIAYNKWFVVQLNEVWIHDTLDLALAYDKRLSKLPYAQPGDTEIDATQRITAYTDSEMSGVITQVTENLLTTTLKLEPNMSGSPVFIGDLLVAVNASRSFDYSESYAVPVTATFIQDRKSDIQESLILDASE